MDFDKALGVALSMCLSDWNNDLSNARIMNALRDEDWDNVTPWQPFEDMEGYLLADHIEDMALSFKRASEEE